MVRPIMLCTEADQDGLSVKMGYKVIFDRRHTLKLIFAILWISVSIANGVWEATEFSALVGRGSL
jgi:hypothetical protein